jgi:hypothetical protein
MVIGLLQVASRTQGLPISEHGDTASGKRLDVIGVEARGKRLAAMGAGSTFQKVEIPPLSGRKTTLHNRRAW